MPKLDKVVFCGTPEFAVPILDSVYATLGSRLAMVITRPDAPSGRGRTLTPSPVKDKANQLSIATAMPATRVELKSIFKSIGPDLIIVVAYGMIFPRSIVDRFFCMNIHGSLLPLYRGASPIHSAILNGDLETGITLIKMNQSMDAGDIIMTDALTIDPNESFDSVHDRLAQLSSTLCHVFIKRFEKSELGLTPQPHDHSTYCHKLSPKDCELLPDMTAIELLNRIRAFSPVPGAYVMANNRRIKIIQATVDNNQLRPLIVRPEGRGDMPYAAYCLGNPPLFKN